MHRDLKVASIAVVTPDRALSNGGVEPRERYPKKVAAIWGYSPGWSHIGAVTIWSHNRAERHRYGAGYTFRLAHIVLPGAWRNAGRCWLAYEPPLNNLRREVDEFYRRATCRSPR